MARAKRILITLDVEEFCDVASILISDDEYRAFLLGFQAGIRGTQGREDSEHFLSGYTIGIEARAAKHKDNQRLSEIGRKGWDALQVCRRQRLQPAPVGSPGALPIGEGDSLPRVAPVGSPVGSACSHRLLALPGPLGNLQLSVDAETEEQNSGQEEEPTINLDGEEPVLLFLPCQKEKRHPIKKNDLGRWLEAFPGIDPLEEAKRMRFWLEENPSRQKTEKGMGKFISSWLRIAQERAKEQKTHGPAPTGRAQLAADYMAANADFFEGVADAS